MIQLLYRNYTIELNPLLKACGILMKLLLHINVEFINSVYCMTIGRNGSSLHYLVGFIDKISNQNIISAKYWYNYRFVLQFDYRIIEKVKEVGYNEES